MNKIRLALACSMHTFLSIGTFLIVLSANFGPLPFLTISDPLPVQNEVLVGSFFFFDDMALSCLQIGSGLVDLIPCNALLSHVFLTTKVSPAFCEASVSLQNIVVL